MNGSHEPLSPPMHDRGSIPSLDSYSSNEVAYISPVSQLPQENQ